MIDDLCQQFLAVRDKLKHKETGLYFHAMDDSRASRWADPETGCSPHVWARAVGWLAMALVDALDWIPVAHSKRPYIEEMLVDLLDALVRAQCSSGLWLQVMDAPEAEGNYEETSASAMFAYALYKSLRKDLTADGNSAKRWKKTADSALAGLITKKVRWECASEPSIELPTRESMVELSTGQSTMPRLHLDGICSVAGLGGSPYRDGSIDYYVGEPIVSDDFKGLGPFMLALTEALRLNQIILS
jgi:unsaturated rhamnogalacturonyl hydrolase